MDDFRGRVAVITGGAGALGRALALRFGAAGMRVELADLDPAALDRVGQEVRGQGIAVGTHVVDVTRAVQVEALARSVIEAHGAVHLLCNNAGVARIGPIWEVSLDEWDWMLGVNLRGVIHGVRAFVPILLRQALEHGIGAHIVNVGSVAGLISPPDLGAYSVSKHAVVALTEVLHHDLAARTDRISCSVVCPAYFPSGIADPGHGPSTVEGGTQAADPIRVEREAAFRHAVTAGRLSAEDIAEQVHRAVLERRFYVITHPKILPAVRRRMEDILQGRTPRSPL